MLFLVTSMQQTTSTRQVNELSLQSKTAGLKDSGGQAEALNTAWHCQAETLLKEVKSFNDSRVHTLKMRMPKGDMQVRRVMMSQSMWP